LDLGRERCALALADQDVRFRGLALAARGRAALVELARALRELVELARVRVRAMPEQRRATLGPLRARGRPALALAGLYLQAAHARRELAQDVLDARHVVGDALQAQLGLDLPL